MRVINLVPVTVDVYNESQFINLERLNKITWVSDGTVGKAIATYPSQGSAWIDTEAVAVNSYLPGEVVQTTYGEATGIPDNLTGDEVLIVSLPMQSMAKSAGIPESIQMVAPYKVVRLRSNTSQVLGCMGFTY